MDSTEMKEVSLQSRTDGERLYKVATWIYKVWIGINWVVAIVGGIASIFLSSSAMEDGLRYGGSQKLAIALAIALITAIFCALNYVCAVLATHFAKVQVDLLFTNLGILENRDEGSK